jgi:hypothetical protein
MPGSRPCPPRCTCQKHRRRTEEERRVLSERRRGWKLTDEQKQARSEGARAREAKRRAEGRPHHATGMRLSDEHKAKVGASLKASEKYRASRADVAAKQRVRYATQPKVWCGVEYPRKVWDAFQARRGSTCELCGKRPKRGTIIDHDHGTGELRGWLCDGCNSALARFGDSVEGLQAALAYLEREREWYGYA